LHTWQSTCYIQIDFFNPFFTQILFLNNIFTEKSFYVIRYDLDELIFFRQYIEILEEVDMIREKDLEMKMDSIRGKLTDPLVLIGFPGIAMVGKLAVLNIAKTLEAIPCQAIYFSDFPPQALISQDGYIRIPQATLHVARNVANRDIIIISADYQPITQAGIYQFSDYICKTCKELKVKAIIATGAFVSQRQVTGDRKIYVSGTSREIIDFFMTSSSVNTVLFNVGYITGANGVIPAWGSIHYDIEGACLLADALPMLQFDPKASKAIVQVISEKYDLPMDVEDLNKEIENIEIVSTQLSEVMKEEEKRPKYQPYFG